MSGQQPVAVDTSRKGAGGTVRVPLAAVLAGFLIAINLRPAVTSIAGGFPLLGAAFGPTFALGSPWLLALGSAPLLAFGLSAPLGPWLARRWGVRRTLVAAMIVLAAALALRVVSPALVLPGTVLAGVVIMIGSVLVPQLVKEYGGPPWFSGVTALGMGAGAALGAGLLTPMVATVGLAPALASWAAPAAVAGLAVGVALKNRPPAASHDAARAPRDARPVRVPLLKSRTALAVAGYFGIQAMLFFTVTSWLPTFLTHRGVDPAAASGYLGLFNVAGLPASLLVPLLLTKPRWQRLLGSGLGLVLACTFLWMIVAPLSAVGWVVAVLGIAQSGAFSYALAIVVVRAADPRTAGRLSALSQGAGYALAAVGPFAAGAIAQATGGWDAPFLLMAVTAVTLVALGAFVSRGAAVGAVDAGPTAHPVGAAAGSRGQ